MGMLLRHRPKPDNMTTTESFGKPEKVEVKPIVAEPVKEETKTVKRGRPTKR